MIDTREELFNALTEAAEIEHTLLIQYLFAAFSLKRRLDEGITPMQQAEIMSWERTLLEVAKQEMGHLGLVCNLLSSIGGAPQFNRPNLPMPAGQYFPLSEEFTLSRFSSQTLYRFVCFELPRDLDRPRLEILKEHSFVPTELGPDPTLYNRVGGLYQTISDAFLYFDKKNINLFIGPRSAQDEDKWSEQLNLQLVYDTQTALKAIGDIIEDGEGSSKDRSNSHFMRFFSMWEKSKNLDYQPARDVVDNPLTQIRVINKNMVYIIEDERTSKVSKLLSTVYNTMLMMLVQYYSYNGETHTQRAFLRNTLGQIMSGVIRPLAEILTELPVTNDKSMGVAGPGFEIFTDLRLPPFPDSRWCILQERFLVHITDLKEVQEAHPRLASVGDSIQWISNNLNEMLNQTVNGYT